MTTAIQIQFRFLFDWDSNDDGEIAMRYPILRQTPQSLWVHRRHYDYWNLNQTGYGFPTSTEWVNCRTAIEKLHGDFNRIPKQAIETEGRYFQRRKWYGFHKALPDKWQGIVGSIECDSVEECLQFFGVGVMTAEEFEKAYRSMALKLHPDHGGDKDAFQAMQYQAELCRNILSH